PRPPPLHSSGPPSPPTSSPHAYLRPPHRHSFPTRRSSDLATLPVAFFDLSGAKIQRDANSVTCLRSVLMKPEHSAWIDQISQILDRKSTRLNSSHVSISYAVFCLKKKISDSLDVFHRPALH